MKIGTFTQDGDGYTGSISTAGLSIAYVTLSAMPVKQGSGPDFVILANGEGEQFELGAAWAKTSKKDKPYLSVKLDSPVFVAPINCALIPQIDGSHALVWSRPDLHGDGAKLARYMMTGANGEIARLVETRGLDAFGGDPVTAFDTLQQWAEGHSNCKLPFFHTQTRLAPGETLTDQQWLEVADREEKRLGLTGQPRIIAFHTNPETGEKHLHCAWFRVGLETERAIDSGMYKNHLKQLSRTLEREFALREVSNTRQPHDRASIAGRNEVEEARRLGTDVRAIRTAILDSFERSDNGKSFAAAIREQGMQLANGDRRDCFVVIDAAGGQHALNKKLTGLTLAEVRDRLSNLDRSQLPTVDQAKEMQAERQAARAAQERVKHGRADGAGQGTTLSDGHQRAPQPAIKPLGKTAGEIRLAWQLTATAEQFKERIEDRGLILVHVSREEAEDSHRKRAFAKAVGNQRRELREGFAVVDQRGNLTCIDQRTTGDQWEEIQKRLGGIDKDELVSVPDAKEAQREANRAAWAEQQYIEREKARPASWIETKIAECRAEARELGASVVRDGDGRNLSRVEAVADRLKPDDERSGRLATVYGAEAFAARLDQADIAIVRVRAADVLALDALRRDEDMRRSAAETNGEAYKGQHFAPCEAGDIAAVTRRGDVHRLNPYKLDLEGLESALKTVARDGIDQNGEARLASVTEARAAFEIENRQTDTLWAERRAQAVAERLDRMVAADVRTELRQTTREAEQATSRSFADAGKLVTKGLGLMGRISKALDTVANSILGAFDFLAGPSAPPTREEAQGKQQAAEEQHRKTDAQQTYDAQEARLQELLDQIRRNDAQQRLRRERGEERDDDRGRGRER